MKGFQIFCASLVPRADCVMEASALGKEEGQNGRQ